MRRPAASPRLAPGWPVSFGRFRRDPCGNLPAPQRHCPKCFRVYMDAARERVMVHECRACLERQAEMTEAAERLSSSDEADVTGPDGEEHLVLVGENATSALRQLGAA